MKPREAEAQFLFFYDLRARIVDVPEFASPSANRQPMLSTVDLSKSVLNLFFLSDHFLDHIVALHLHGKSELYKKAIIRLQQQPQACTGGWSFRVSSTQEGSKKTFALSDRVSNHQGGGAEEIDGCRAVEVTLFSNGMLVILIRVCNLESLTTLEYAHGIARPEHARDHPQAGAVNSGLLIQAIWAMMPVIEDEVTFYLKELCKNKYGIPQVQPI